MILFNKFCYAITLSRRCVTNDPFRYATELDILSDMSKWNLWIFAALILSSSHISLAPAGEGGLDAASTEALFKTQQLLRDPEQRNKVIGDSAEAQMVDAQVESLAGNPQYKEAIYSLSNEVFSDLVHTTDGNPEEMQKVLMRAKENPKGFYEGLNEKNKKALQELSNTIIHSPTTKSESGSPR